MFVLSRPALVWRLGKVMAKLFSLTKFCITIWIFQCEEIHMAHKNYLPNYYQKTVTKYRCFFSSTDFCEKAAPDQLQEVLKPC